MPDYLKKRGWTGLELALWILAASVFVVSGVLLLAHAVGHWVLLVGGVLGACLGLMRLRAEVRQQKKGASDDGNLGSLFRGGQPGDSRVKRGESPLP
jgi:O-antigen/teichoic acid export membrane protein